MTVNTITLLQYYYNTIFAEKSRNTLRYMAELQILSYPITRGQKEAFLARKSKKGWRVGAEELVPFPPIFRKTAALEAIHNTQLTP